MVLARLPLEALLCLNNILGWLGNGFDFLLIDNDCFKQGRKYFNKIVKSMKDIGLKNYSKVLIIPAGFYEIIKDQYISAGFKGKIENIF